MHRGYVKLWRKSLESQVWADKNLFRAFICCLLLANHKETWVKVDGLATPIKVEKGQFITGRSAFHKVMYPVKRKSNPNPKTCERWLVSLQDMQILSIKTSNRFSLISILNWEIYQDEMSSRCPAEKNFNGQTGLQNVQQKLNTLTNVDDNGNVQVNVQQVSSRSPKSVHKQEDKNDNNIKDIVSKDTIKKRYGEYCLLKEGEYEKLTVMFGKELTDEKIKDFNLYVGSRQAFNKYKNHYDTILSWDRKEKREQGGNHNGIQANRKPGYAKDYTIRT